MHSEKKKNGLFKEPTCALFEMTGELVAFGLEAKEIYLKRLAEGNLFSFTNGVPKKFAQDCLYFDYDKLKMRLYTTDERQSLENLTAKSSNLRLMYFCAVLTKKTPQRSS